MGAPERSKEAMRRVVGGCGKRAWGWGTHTLAWEEGVGLGALTLA